MMRCDQTFGQHLLPSGPRWYPRGQARPIAIGWQRPPGPRQNPGPQPSATFTIGLETMPTGAGMTPAPAAVASPRASAALNTIVRTIIMCSFPTIVAALWLL